MARQTEEKLPYRVLFTHSEKQTMLASILSELMPEGHGRAFVPMVENYRRDRKEIELKPLFPGYVFLQTDIGFLKLHEIAMESREWLAKTAVRELGRLKWHDGELFLEECEEEKDLSDEESTFIERMLDGGRVLRMSECYEEGKKFVVVKGPLVGLESQIGKVDKHNRRAVLKSKLLGRDIVAGLWVRPKAVFQENTNVGELPDGSEVDLEGLESKMMSIGE